MIEKENNNNNKNIENKFLENKNLINNENNNNNINEIENLSKKNIENNIENELNNLKTENLNLKQTIKNLKKENENIKNENLLLTNQIKLLNKNSTNKTKFFSEDEIIFSKIIIKDEIKTLKNWILNQTIKFKLLMNNETSNISIENFHLLCDNKPTLILIKTKEKDRIGGFKIYHGNAMKKKEMNLKKIIQHLFFL